VHRPSYKTSPLDPSPRAGLFPSIMFLHALLFFALGASIVSCDSNDITNNGLQQPLKVPGISRYGAGEWHRKPLTDVYDKNRNDVMEIMKYTGYIRFGKLNDVAGSRSIMSQESKWANGKSRKRAVGSWRRMPNSTISLEDRLALLDITKATDGTLINAQIRRVPMIPKSTSSILSILKDAGPLPDDAEGTWYRVSGGGSDDVIVISQGKAPVLYQLNEFGGKKHVRDSIRVNHIVGAWLRWPDASGKSGPKNLLRFWIRKGKLEYVLGVI